MDIEQPAVLISYLRSTGRIGTRERPRCIRLAGGVSNRTVLVQRDSGEAWVLKQALPNLRVPLDWFSSPERVQREALGMKWLAELVPARTIPRLVFEDEKHYLLAMEAVPQPHDVWKSLLLDGRLEDDHVRQFGNLLGQIHRNGYERRQELASIFENQSTFESLRVEPFYLYVAANVPAASTFLRELVEDVRCRRITLVHGDYSPKNVLIYQGRLVLLDHEVIHFGDPAFDVGFSLTHLLSKANHLVHRRSDYAEASLAYWHAYREAVGDLGWSGDVEERAVRHTLGCLLARVAGRSELEYLDKMARSRQFDAASSLMAVPPAGMEALVDRFIAQL